EVIRADGIVDRREAQDGLGLIIDGGPSVPVVRQRPTKKGIFLARPGVDPGREPGLEPLCPQARSTAAARAVSTASRLLQFTMGRSKVGIEEHGRTPFARENCRPVRLPNRVASQ